MRKNITFIRLQDFPPSSSIDMYYYVKYLSKTWLYNIDVITWKKTSDIDFDNVDIHYTNLDQKNNIKTLFIFMYKSIKQLHKIKKSKKIDYVYFFSMHPISVLIQLYSKYILRLKTIYDVTSWPIWNTLSSKISYLTIKLWILLSDKFILDDKWLYNKLNLKTKKSYEIIWIWYDKEIFYPKKWVNLFNKNENEIIFTYIWTLNNERKLDIFIKAFIESIKTSKNIKLYIIWWWSWEKKLKSISKTYLDKNIFFLWKKEHKKIPDYINSSDILVSYIPKIDYFEYQPPTKLIEYLACNKPVIATNTIAQEEILKWYEKLIHKDDFESTKEKINYFIDNYEYLIKKEYTNIVDWYDWKSLVKSLDNYIKN